MSKQPNRWVHKETRIDAAPEDVLSAWTDPERISQWFTDLAEGHAEAGKTVTWHFDDLHSHPLSVVEVVAGQRVVYAVEMPGRPAWTIEVRVEPERGSTLLRLTHSGFLEGAEWDEEYEGIDSGWSMALGQLKHWLERYPTRRRTHFLVMRDAPLDPGVLRPLFTTGAGLGSWLADRAELGDPELVAGTRLRLDLGELGELAGPVLVRTRREVLLSWPQRRAVMGLKAFYTAAIAEETGEPMEPRSKVAIDFSAWGLEPAERPALEVPLGAAVSRLADELTGAAEGRPARPTDRS